MPPRPSPHPFCSSGVALAPCPPHLHHEAIGKLTQLLLPSLWRLSTPAILSYTDQSSLCSLELLQ